MYLGEMSLHHIFFFFVGFFFPRGNFRPNKNIFDHQYIKLNYFSKFDSFNMFLKVFLIFPIKTKIIKQRADIPLRDLLVTEERRLLSCWLA